MLSTLLSFLSNRNGLITPCGQEKAHWLHSIQFSLIQQGTSSAMFLFSSLVVVPSKIPSLFFIKLLTGNVSPLSKFMLSLKVNFWLSLYSKSFHSSGTSKVVRYSRELSITLLLISTILSPFEANLSLLFYFSIFITLFIS